MSVRDCLFDIMWNLHGGHCEIDKYVEMYRLDIIMYSIELSHQLNFITPVNLTYIGNMIPILQLTA